MTLWMICALCLVVSAPSPQFASFCPCGRSQNPPLDAWMSLMCIWWVKFYCLLYFKVTCVHIRACFNAVVYWFDVFVYLFYGSGHKVKIPFLFSTYYFLPLKLIMQTKRGGGSYRNFGGQVISPTTLANKISWPTEWRLWFTFWFIAAEL